MAGLGFKDFQVGEVLTSSDVDGYLMQQSVMRFADSAARGSALGTAPGTAVALAEGMVTYLDATNTVQMYDGTNWVGIGNFSASTAITTTDASWAVPTLADPVVRVTVVAGGGGGANHFQSPSAGSSSVFDAGSAGTATATGGGGGVPRETTVPDTADDILLNSNEGRGYATNGSGSGSDGVGGQIVVAYFDLTGVSTVSVTCGAGGGGAPSAGDGGDGFVIVEYRAV